MADFFPYVLYHSDHYDRETRQMAALLAKFRIDYSDVVVIPDVTKKAAAATKAEFDNIIAGLDISPNELIAEREKTNRWVVSRLKGICILAKA